MPRKSYTTADLRRVLVDSIEAVRSGGMKADQAMGIVKLAGQINETFKVEIALAHAARERGAKTLDMGSLVVCEHDVAETLPEPAKPALLAPETEREPEQEEEEEEARPARRTAGDSPQTALILRILANAGRPLTPSEVHDAIPSDQPLITVAAVRMTIDRLHAQARVSRIDAEGKRAAYQLA